MNIIIRLMAVYLLVLTGCTELSSERGYGFSAAYDVSTPEVLRDRIPLYAERGLSPIVGMSYQRMTNEMVDVIRYAQQQGVKVRLFLGTPEAEEWANDKTVDYHVQLAYDVADWFDEHGLAPSVIHFDMETELSGSLALIEAQTTFDVAAILNLLKERRDVNRFERAKVIFNRAITQLRAREWKVGVTTVPLALDDHIDADGGLRLSFGLVVEGVDWDFITFQVYTSQYRRSLEQVNHDLVYQYALEARRQYGDKAGLDLGVTVFDGLTGSEGLTQEELKRDVEAALAAGIPEEQIFIFSFDGILQTVEARGLDLDDYFQPVDPLFYINVEPFTYVARAAGWAIDTLIDEGASNPSAIDQAEAITLAPHWIQNEDNGLCLTAENLAEGAGLTTQECTGLLTQQWRVDSDRQYIMSSDERFCLTHTGSHAEEGAAVRLSQCANLPEQRWAVLNYLGVMLNLEQRELALATNGNSVELRQGHTRQDNLWRYWQFIAAD